MKQSAVLILGGGVVGICCAIACRRLGLDVALADGAGQATETSAGNSGVICNSGIHPLASPEILRATPRLLANRDTRFLIRYRTLPGLTPWLTQFAARCTASDHANASASLVTLTRDALPRHQQLMADAGSETLLQPTGWLKLFDDETSWRTACQDIDQLHAAGVLTESLDAKDLRALEPGLGDFHKFGLWMKNTHTVASPSALCASYFKLFRQLGGRFEKQHATALRKTSQGWQASLGSEIWNAQTVIIALGAWSNALLNPIGHKLPIIQERGYHLMFDYPDGKRLNRSVVDPVRGFVVTPMSDGLRVTSAANPVARESEPDPRQLERLLPTVRRTVPLGAVQMQTPWMGRRPSTPDSLPLIGPVGDDPTLIAATGHGHLGLTLAPVTGDLVANLIAGNATESIHAFSPNRLG